MNCFSAFGRGYRSARFGNGFAISFSLGMGIILGMVGIENGLTVHELPFIVGYALLHGTLGQFHKRGPRRSLHFFLVLVLPAIIALGTVLVLQSRF